MDILSRVRKTGRVFSAVDTAALALFSLATFFLPAFWELVFAKTTLEQSSWIRAFTFATFILKHLFAGILNTLTHSIEGVLPGRAVSGFRKSTAKGIALWLYQLPPYLLGAVTMSFSLYQILLVQGIMFLESPAIGWIHDKILNYTRKRFGASEHQDR